MNQNLEPAAICEHSNLPRFRDKQALYGWMSKNCPGTHITEVFLCRECQGYHTNTKARGPSGESSGTGRGSK